MRLCQFVTLFVMALFLSACGDGDSSSGAAAEEPASLSLNTASASDDEIDSLVTEPSCTITAIELTPSSGEISKVGTSLRALVSFDYISATDDNFQVYDVDSEIKSKDRDDYIFSDPLVRSNLSLSQGKGKIFLSYNLRDKYSAEPDLYTEARVAISGSFYCEAFKAVNFILTR